MYIVSKRKIFYKFENYPITNEAPFYCFFLSIQTSLVLTQEINKKYHLKHSIKQENEQFEFKVVDFDYNGRKKYEKDKMYYWLKSQQIMATQGFASGLLLHGDFVAYYTSKQLSKKGKYFYGLKHGEWIYWNEDGLIKQIENWKNGVLLGKQELYDKNGKLLYKGYLSKKKSQFLYQDSLVELNKKANTKTITFINKQKKYTHTVKTKDSKLHGKQIQYKDGKVLKKEFYLNGEKMN